MEYQSAAGLRPKPLKGLSETRWNCQGRSVQVIRSRLLAVTETLERIRNESADRKVIGEAVGLLAYASKFEFAVAIEFFFQTAVTAGHFDLFRDQTQLYTQLPR